MVSLTARAISTAGLSLETKVADLVLNDCWTWPIEWEAWYPNIYHSTVPSLNFNKDQLVWKDRLGRDKEFSVGVVWEDIRPRGNEMV